LQLRSLCGYTDRAQLAAYDAAWIRFVGAPKTPDPYRWRDIATRFRAAAGSLSDASLRERALERARAARKAVRP